MMHFLKLIRYQNLSMLVLMQLVFHFGFLKKQLPELALTDGHFLLLVLATACIAAGGYLINDVFDKNIDKINRPETVIIDRNISENQAFNYYIALNIIGVGLGFYLSNHIGRSDFSALFIVIAATLYLYAQSLKKSLLVGNIIIACLLSVSVLIVGIYDLLPIITPENIAILGNLFQIFIDFALFAFLINLIREIVKDIEDIEGDRDFGVKSIPVVWGIKTSKIIISALLAIAILTLSTYLYVYIFENNLLWVLFYALFLILTPLIYVLIKLWEASSKSDFSHISLVLKGILFFGILAILVIVYNIELNTPSI